MVDLIKIRLQAGNGGDGRISFLSNRYQLKGGPDGGNGGNGGSIVIVGDRNLHSLRDYAGKAAIEADNGVMGGKRKMAGAGSQDTVIKLPVGTSIWRSLTDYEPRARRKMYSIDRKEGRREWIQGLSRMPRRALSIIPKILPLKSGPPKLTKVFSIGGESYEAQWVGEINEDGQNFKVVRGGRGGRGNFEFRSSVHTTPREAETGEKGEAGTYFFELQVLADVGLVGFPNAGKSTLLSVLTKARPQIANYPFTTIEPNLGILEYESHREEDKASFVVADIPGIIEGASQGKGLGTAFLRHIERSRVLIFVLALEDYDVIAGADDVPQLSQKLIEQFTDLMAELEEYEKQLAIQGDHVSLTEKKRLVVINKADLYTPELQEALSVSLGETLSYPMFISAKTNIHIDKLKNALRTLL